MLYFADAETVRDAADAALETVGALRAAIAAPPGIARHEALVAALIAAGELLQGVADRDLVARGIDAPSPAQHAATALTLAAARAVARSWRSGFRLAAAPGRLDLAPLAGAVRVRRPEGYAFHAAYPEAWFAAAERSDAGPDAAVLGVRSIGASLAAMVAVGLGAATFRTVRPLGPLEAREVRLADPPHGRPVAIVDEGPGLTGQSFAAVDRAAAGARVWFFAGHPHGPGPEATAAVRAAWARATVLACPVDPLLPRLLPGFAWAAPAVDHPFEARPTLTDGAGRRARFVGLGDYGRQAFARAAIIAAAGFAPRPLALRHGFLIEEAPSGPCEPPDADRVARYLAFRAGLPAADAESGAGPAALLAMIRRNAALAFGSAPAEPLARWEAALPALAAARRPVWTDNRLHRTFWRGGRKTDGADAAFGHDLVGPQDALWDAVGAALELDLPPAPLIAAAGGAEGPRAALLRLCQAAYPAFQLGRAHYAGAEQAPYRAALAHALGQA